MRGLLRFAAVPLLLLGCEGPRVSPTQDRRQNQEASRIEGRVLVSGTVRGNAVLFLFDAARPPPPEGTGRPLSFTVVPARALFGAALLNAADTGPFSAPYVFSLVPPGRYLIRGFIDRDGCLGSPVGCRPADFIPWYGVTAEPNAGDVGGAAVDAATRAARVVEIAPLAEGGLSAATEVPVSFSEALAVPVDRPTFEVTSGGPVVSTTGPTLLELTLRPVQEGPVYQGQPGFLAQLVDANQDGTPDDAWPKVFVRKLSGPQTPLLDENDLDHNGVIDASGVDYPHLDSEGREVPADGVPDRVVLAAQIDFSELSPFLLDGEGKPKPAPTVVNKLKVAVLPQAFDATDPRSPKPLARPPPGVYSLTLLQLTGQTWRLPNELAPEIAAQVGLPQVASQRFMLEVK